MGNKYFISLEHLKIIEAFQMVIQYYLKYMWML